MGSPSSFFSNKKNLLPLGLLVLGIILVSFKPIYSFLSPVKLDLKIQNPPVIMPAVYKVYNNENAMEGKYSLFKMLVTNTSNSKATNVEVAYQIPNYVDKKTIMKIPMILPGESVVVNCYPSFQDKIVEKTTSSREQVNIWITGSNISDIEQNFAIDIKGRNEFIYSCIPADEIRTSAEYFDNMPLLTCFVTPEDPIIKYYTQKIQEKVLKGEAASVENKEAEGVRFMTGIYYATLISHMVYSGTSGVPAKIDDVSSLIQSIRLPREVITGKTGLCIELTLLYASIMMNAGMDPIIYLIPGHAYPGFRMNGNYYAIESTGIGGEGLGGRMTTEQAFKTGMKNLQEFFQYAAAGDDRYQMVDVRESIRKGAVAMELKDDSYLRQKIDEIAQAFDPNYRVNTNQQPTNYQNAREDNNNNNNNNNDNNDSNAGNDNNNNNNSGRSTRPAGYNLYQGTVTFAYPGSWKIAPRNPQFMPQLKHLIANANNTAYVEVYNFSGYSNTQQAFAAIQQYISNYGGVLQYRQAGATNSGYQIFTGQTALNGQAINWMAALKPTSSGVRGIVSGANSATGTQYQSTIATIINSLQ
jgi:hypothetical protein